MGNCVQTKGTEPKLKSCSSGKTPECDQNKSKGSSSSSLSSMSRDSIDWKDEEAVLAEVSNRGWMLQNASDEIKNNKNVVLAAVRNNWRALQYANEEFKNDRDVVLVAVQQFGDALEFVSEEIRKDEEIVKEAVRTTPSSLQFARGELSQDIELMKLAGETNTDKERLKNKTIVLSSRSILDKDISPYANKLILKLKENDFFNSFHIFNPNELNLNSNNGSNFQDTDGASEKQDSLECGEHKQECYERNSFQYQLEEAKKNDGIMLQIIERENDNCILGKSQKIECEMAEQAGLKIFQIHQNNSSSIYSLTMLLQVRDVAKKVEKWYDGRRKNMSIEKIYMKKITKQDVLQCDLCVIK